MSASAADQSAAPAAKDEELAARSRTAPDRMRPSPIVKTRNPAAKRSWFDLRNHTLRMAPATTRATPSIPQASARTDAEEANVPASPNALPTISAKGASRFAAK